MCVLDYRTVLTRVPGSYRTLTISEQSASLQPEASIRRGEAQAVENHSLTLCRQSVVTEIKTLEREGPPKERPERLEMEQRTPRAGVSFVPFISTLE